MPKSNAVKLQTLLDNLVAVTIINTPVDIETVYLALFVTTPGGGNTGTEVAYGGYARRPISFGAPQINGGVAEILNDDEIEFATVQSSSGTMAHVGILTALTGGSLLYYAPLAATYSLNQGVKPTVPIGSLKVYES